MQESLSTPSMMINTSLPDQTTIPGEKNQMVFVSGYLKHYATWMLWLIVAPVLLVLGSYGNVMVIVVMRAMRASESTGCLSVYFTALAVSDLFNLWTNILCIWPETVLDTPLTYFHDFSCKIPVFVVYVSPMTSAWFLVAMTCQRMMSVMLPHRVDGLCTVRKGKIIVFSIFLTACSTNLYIFFYYHIEDVGGGYLSCVITDTTVPEIFSFLYLCLASVVPFLVLIIANSVLVYGVVQSVKMSGKMAGRGDSLTSSRSAKVSSMTTTLILTSVAFLILTLPSCILWIYFSMIGYYEGDIDDEALSEQLAMADTVCLLIWLSNNTVNFYIYILSGKKFRQEARQYACIFYTKAKIQA